MGDDVGWWVCLDFGVFFEEAVLCCFGGHARMNLMLDLGVLSESIGEVLS